MFGVIYSLKQAYEFNRLKQKVSVQFFFNISSQIWGFFNLNQI